MAKQVVVHIELEDGTELKEPAVLRIEQDLFGHHTFEIHVPFDALEDRNELFFHNSHRNVCGKSVRVSFEKVYDEDEDFKFKFKGIVTELALKNTSDLSNVFVLKGYSTTILLEDSRVRRTFLQQDLKGIVNKVLQVYPSNLIKYSVKTRQSAVLRYVVQYDESNFEFLARLAAEYGEWCFFDGQQLVFGEPSDDEVDFLIDGTQTFDMSLKLLPSKIKYARYDYLADELYESHTDDQQVDGLGQWSKFSLDESENVFSQESQLPLPKPVYSQDELNSVTKTEKARQASRLVEFRGSGENPDISVGTIIKVKGTRITERGTSEENFGKYRITHVSHAVDGSGNYANTFRAVPESVTQPPPNPAFKLPAGLPELAKVVDNDDPEKLGRVKVQFLWPGSDNRSDWVRVGFPYTDDGQGMLFIPEIDAQVMIGYESNLAEYPFVMTSLYPKSNTTPETESDNNLKYIQTRGGNVIKLYDEDGKQYLELTNTNLDGTRITLAFESDGKISLETDGTIELKGKDIEIKATNNLTLEAQNNIELKATNGVTVEGTATVDVKGTNVTVKANAQAAVQGTQTSVKGDAMVEVKGGVIMLN